MNIKFSKSNIKKTDINLVNKIIKSGWLTHGKYTDLFEESFRRLTKSKYAITVSSCTAGLHLSCMAAGFKQGDEVIVPAITHTATAHAVEYTGAKPIFCDVEPLTGNLTLEIIKNKLTPKTKGVIVVHMAGLPCEIIKISKFCKKNKIILIEDCAHAVGSIVKNKHVGNYGISGCFSFYPTKQVTTGEGGMIITNQKMLFQKMKRLKAFGIDKDIKDRKKPGLYDVKELGYNFRMTDFQASLGYNQVKRYSSNLLLRKKIAKRYIKNLVKVNGIKFPKFSSDCSYFIFQIFTKKRDMLLNYLKKNNIGTSIHYAVPLINMSYYRKKYKFNKKNFKNSLKYSDSNISLPVYPSLKLKEVDYICNCIKGFFKIL
jgi:perosamine synthetase